MYDARPSYLCGDSAQRARSSRHRPLSRTSCAGSIVPSSASCRFVPFRPSRRSSPVAVVVCCHSDERRATSRAVRSHALYGFIQLARWPTTRVSSREHSRASGPPAGGGRGRAGPLPLRCLRSAALAIECHWAPLGVCFLPILIASHPK